MRFAGAPAAVMVLAGCVGNVILGGAIGLGVDAASSAINHDNDNNQIVLTPDPTRKA